MLALGHRLAGLRQARAAAVRVAGFHGSVSRAGAMAVPLTSERYPHVRRGSYKRLEESDIAHFRTIMAPERVQTEQDVLDAHNMDWLRKYRGNSQLVLKPKTVGEVSAALKYCHDQRLAVVPQGGNTGLVGGSVPVFDEIVISLALMNDVHSFDAVSGIVHCGAGCILESLDHYLEGKGFAMPLDLGAKGSCQIGGNVATNAGGIRLLRYGSLHGSVLGLEVVLPDGRVLDTISPCRKDNTGYDLKQLFIGSEGTLGIITAVSLVAPRRSTAVNVAFLGCPDYPSVLKTLSAAKEKLGEILSACEFLDDASMRVVNENLPMYRNPLSDHFPFYVLIETSGSNNDHDMEKLGSFLEDLMSDGTCVDGTVAQDTTQAQELWGIREGITEALRHDGYVYKYDISLPVPSLYEIVEHMRDRCSGAIRVAGYGHVGDGNLHLNITSKELDPKILGAIEPYVYEFTANVRGSISAEHGLGFMKPHCIGYSKSETAVSVMRDIKRLLDPHLIMNPYKTIPFGDEGE